MGVILGRVMRVDYGVVEGGGGPVEPMIYLLGQVRPRPLGLGTVSHERAVC
jgi:hypothetical protein